MQLNLLIALDELGKTAGALYVATSTEKLCAICGTWYGRNTENIFPCSNKVLDYLWRNDLGLTQCELVRLADNAVGNCRCLHIRIVGVGVVTIMATYQLINNIERADVVPSVWCLGKLGKHIRNIYLGKLLVEINFHFMLGICKFGIYSIVFARVDIAENSLL